MFNGFGDFGIGGGGVSGLADHVIVERGTLDEGWGIRVGFKCDDNFSYDTDACVGEGGGRVTAVDIEFIVDVYVTFFRDSGEGV